MVIARRMRPCVRLVHISSQETGMRAIGPCAAHHFHVICFESQKGRSSVAEQRPFKPLVVGSTPTAPTNNSRKH